jgi:predicted nucleic acid-binding protein
LHNATKNSLNQAAYDVHYLALAELLGCELWTADEKFFNSVKKKKPQVRLLSVKGSGT